VSKLEIILLEAESLTNAERRQLAELLLEQAALEAADDDRATGLRGLQALTESVAEEDWYYPGSLRDSGHAAS
jgi:hypothetical protein